MVKSYRLKRGLISSSPSEDEDPRPCKYRHLEVIESTPSSCYLYHIIRINTRRAYASSPNDSHISCPDSCSKTPPMCSPSPCNYRRQWRFRSGELIAYGSQYRIRQRCPVSCLLKYLNRQVIDMQVSRQCPHLFTPSSVWMNVLET